MHISQKIAVFGLVGAITLGIVWYSGIGGDMEGGLGSSVLAQGGVDSMSCTDVPGKIQDVAAEKGLINAQVETLQKDIQSLSDARSKLDVSQKQIEEEKARLNTFEHNFFKETKFTNADELRTYIQKITLNLDNTRQKLAKSTDFIRNRILNRKIRILERLQKKNSALLTEYTNALNVENEKIKNKEDGQKQEIASLVQQIAQKESSKQNYAAALQQLETLNTQLVAKRTTCAQVVTQSTVSNASTNATQNSGVTQTQESTAVTTTSNTSQTGSTTASTTVSSGASNTGTTNRDNTATTTTPNTTTATTNTTAANTNTTTASTTVSSNTTTNASTTTNNVVNVVATATASTDTTLSASTSSIISGATSANPVTTNITTVTCPVYTPPEAGFCSGGQIIDGGVDTNGCQKPATCGPKLITGSVTVEGVKDCWFGDATKQITLGNLLSYQTNPTSNSGIQYIDEIILYGATAPTSTSVLTNILSYEDPIWTSADGSTLTTAMRLTNFFVFRTNSDGTRTWNIPTTGTKFYGCFARGDRPNIW